MAHSRISPSGSDRWMQCAASVPWSMDVPRSSNVASATGTLIHRIAEFGLREAGDLSIYLNTCERVDGFDITVGQKHLDIAQAYIDYIAQTHLDLGGELHIEKRVCASEIHPECSGTADAVIVGSEKIIVCDLKTGRWGVDVQDNPQLKIYALGALEMFGTEEHKIVETVIVQPTGWHRDGPIRSASYDVGNLVEWGFNTLRPAALACFEPDPEPVAGEHCRFCPAKPNCPMHSEGEANEIIGHKNEISN